MEKTVIYQLLPRLFTNYCETPVFNGTIMQNGSGKLNYINTTILKEIKQLGATHVWYTGVIEHAHNADYTSFGIRRDNRHIVKGHAGSPYAITDYYDIDPDIAVDVDKRIDEFCDLVDRTHKAGLKVIIDFVPNHVGREYHSDAKPAGIEDLGESDNKDCFFSPTNNFYYITRQKFSPVDVNLGEGDDAYDEFPAKASGNDCFNAFPGKFDWYDTVKLNYGIDPWNGSHHFSPIPPTWMKMLNILNYWAAKGVDGFRCDMAHMVPLEFWNWAISNVKEKYPHIIFIAEIYDVSLYRPFIDYGRFDFLYDKVNLYDTLHDIQCGNVSAANITSCWQTVEGIAPHMLNFLENHDEVRFASPQYAGDAGKVTPSLVVSALFNTGAMMIYAGQELGEDAKGAVGYSGDDGRTSIFDYTVIPSLRKWLNNGKCNGLMPESVINLRELYRRVLNICNSEKAVSEGSFFDLMYVNYENPGFNPHCQYAFMRHHDDTTLIIVANFSAAPAEVDINIPALALEMMDITPGEYAATDLLSQRQEKITLDDSRPLHTSIDGYGAVVWKIKNSSSDNKIEKNG